MQWLQSAFQGQSPGPTLLGIVIGLAIALVLLFWVFRKIAGTGAHGARRSSEPRLAVVDAARIDGKRRLVLVRRDGVEHLVMIGGGSDVLIEANIGQRDTHASYWETEHSPPVRASRETAYSAPAATGAALALDRAAEEILRQSREPEPVEVASNVGPEPVEPLEMASHVEPEPVEPPEVASNVGPEPVEPPEVASNVEPEPVEPAEVASNVGPEPVESPAVASNVEPETAETVVPLTVEDEQPAAEKDSPLRPAQPDPSVFPVEAQTRHNIAPDEPPATIQPYAARETEPLEEALGAELEGTAPPMSETEAAPEVVLSESQQRDKDEAKPRPGLSRDSKVEDEMQRLLDELSNT